MRRWEVNESEGWGLLRRFSVRRGVLEIVIVGEADPLDIPTFRELKKKAAQVAAELNDSPTYP